MKEQDLLAKAETYTASVFPGAEERNEDTVHQRRRNTRSIVGNLDIDLTASNSRECRQLYPGISLVFYRFNGVHQQIDQDLFDQGSIQFIRKVRVLKNDFQLHVLLVKGR